MFPVFGQDWNSRNIHLPLSCTALGKQSQPAHGGSQEPAPRQRLQQTTSQRHCAVIVGFWAPPPTALCLHAGADRGAGGPADPGGAAAHLGQTKCTRCWRSLRGTPQQTRPQRWLVRYSPSNSLHKFSIFWCQLYVSKVLRDAHLQWEGPRTGFVFTMVVVLSCIAASTDEPSEIGWWNCQWASKFVSTFSVVMK